VKHSILYLANWKMYLSYKQEIQFFSSHKKQFIELAQQNNATIALFPSYVSLDALSQETKNTGIVIGAQDCSAEIPGTFTGQVSAQSLAQLGCTFCLVGHSELRKLGQINGQVVQKIIRLYENKITPVICIGETEAEYKQDETTHVIKQQLIPILDLPYLKKMIIAYEPVWAIGSHKTPRPDEIEQVFAYIDSIIKESDKKLDYRLVYGGSVTSSNV